MKLANKIFKRADWYVTSSFGKRKHPITGQLSFHQGTDYGTDVEKWGQYAIEDGYVYKVTRSASGYGNSIWVRYPRINRSLFHAHLDSIKVKEGQNVSEGTLLGYTGTSGSSTGIHLHLGMTEIGKDKWLDPHAYNYEPPKPKEDDKILEDGYWGVDTTKKAQKVFGTPVDGIVSNQYSKYKSDNPGLLDSTFEWETKPDKNGSPLIGKIQKLIGSKVDNFIGTDTIKDMQKFFKTPVDGKVSKPSLMVKEFQKWLNKQ